MVCLMARKTFAPFVHAQTCARVRFQIEIYWAGKRTKASGWHGMGGYVSLLYCSLVALIIHPFRKSSEMQNSIARNTTYLLYRQASNKRCSKLVPVQWFQSSHQITTTTTTHNTLPLHITSSSQRRYKDANSTSISSESKGHR